MRASPSRSTGEPVTSAEKYVAAAYGVVFLVVLAYVLIISLKLVRLEREVAELADLVQDRLDVREPTPVG
jgi:CcmD family protein